MDRGGGGLLGGQGGKKAAEVLKVRAFLEFEMKVLLGEVEMSEPVLVHEFDDSTDFLEVHGYEDWELGGERRPEKLPVGWKG